MSGNPIPNGPAKGAERPAHTGVGMHHLEPRPLVKAAGRSNEHRFRLLWAALALVIVASLSLSTVTEHRATVKAARSAVADAALMLRQHMQRHLDGADLILRHAAAEVVRHGWVAATDPGADEAGLTVLVDGTAWATGLWIRDTGGTLRFASRPAGPDLRPAIAEAARRAVAVPHRLAVGRPITAPGDGWPSFTVGRAIVDPQGTVLGAAVLAVSGDELAASFSRQALGVNGSLGLVRSDGLLLARHPASAMIGRMIPKDEPVLEALTQGRDRGVLETVSPVDGQPRYVAFARLGHQPLAAVATRAVGDVRGEALESLRPQYLLGGLLIAVLAILYPLMMRRLRSEREAAGDLVERELLFRSILNNVGIGLSLVSADGTIRYANAGFDRLLGYEPGSLTGRNLETLTHPDDRLSTMYRVSRMEALGPTGLSYESRYITRDGGVLEALVTLSLKPRIGDQEPLLVAVVQDLTDQRAREKAIAFRNSLLRTQQEASPDGILVADADGRLQSWNRRFRDIWDVPEPLLESGDLSAVLRHINAAVREASGPVVGAACGGPGAEDADWLRRRLSMTREDVRFS